MSATILVLWLITLAAVVLLVAPTAFYLLNRTNSAARDVERYTAETLEAARGISASLSGMAVLEETPARVEGARKAARGLTDEANDLARVVRGPT